MKSLLSALAVATLCAVAAEAKDTTSFHVDSYIPERFTDFQWRLSGSAGIDGSNNESSSSSVYPYYPANAWRSSSGDFQQIQLATRISYDFVTIPTMYRYSLDAGISGTHSKSSESASNSAWNRLVNTIESEYSEHRWGFSLFPAFSLTKYVAHHFYVSPSISANVIFNDWGNKDERTTQTYDSVGQVTNTAWSLQKNDGYSWSGGARAQAEAGIGRVYSAQFAFLAMSIIEELRSAGVVVREPGYGEMTRLCDTILEYRMRHEIDRRYRRVAALTAILNLLRSDGIITSEDATLPFIIADIWDYYPGRNRSFGYRAGTGGELNYTDAYYQERRERPDSRVITYPYISSQRTSTGRVIVYEQLEYHRPLSLRWQLDLNSRITVLLNRYRVQEDDWTDGIEHAVWSHMSGGGVSYYYDSRTTISAQIYASRNEPAFYGYSSSTDRDDLLEVGSSITYRLSVPTTLRANAIVQWNSSRGDTPLNDRRDSHRYSFGVSIEHWLY